jgi:hypothetical protein
MISPVSRASLATNSFRKDGTCRSGRGGANSSFSLIKILGLFYPWRGKNVQLWCGLRGGGFTRGSVILLGSLSDLMNQGAAGHAKALCREVRRLSGLFQGSATVVPFIPPPIFGTNNTSLIMAISDVTNWLDSVQSGNFMDYNSALRAQIRASIWEKNSESQQGESIEFPPHKLIFPDNVGLHNDKIFELPGEQDLPKSLPPMSAESESALYKPLFEGLNVLFKWDIDTTPSISRDNLSSSLPAGVPDPLHHDRREQCQQAARGHGPFGEGGRRHHLRRMVSHTHQPADSEVSDPS